MITFETLKEFGIDPKDGLARCMNKEEFYFKMLKMGLSNEYFIVTASGSLMRNAGLDVEGNP